MTNSLKESIYFKNNTRVIRCVMCLKFSLRTTSQSQPQQLVNRVTPHVLSLSQSHPPSSHEFVHRSLWTSAPRNTRTKIFVGKLYDVKNSEWHQTNWHRHERRISIICWCSKSPSSVKNSYVDTYKWTIVCNLSNTSLKTRLNLWKLYPFKELWKLV